MLANRRITFLIIRPFSIFIFMLFSGFSLAQTSWYKNYGVKDGLVQMTVNAISQDKMGFIWMGTQNGLSRYDGYRFKNFQHDPKDDNSLSHNYVGKLLFDSQDNLWIMTSKGLDKYEPDKEQFSHYETVSFDKDFFSSLFVWSLQEGPDRSLLLVTTKGVIVFDIGREEFYFLDSAKRQDQNQTGSSQLWQSEINDSLMIDQSTIIFATSSGVYRYDTDEKKDVRIEPADMNDENNEPRLYCMSNEFQNVRFYCSRSGVYFSQSDKLYFLSNNLLKLPSAPIKLHINPINQELWVGTFDGAFVKSLDLKKFPKSFLQTKLEKISNDKVLSIYQDKDNVMWIGTDGNGISKIIPNARVFKHIESNNSKGSVAGENLKKSSFLANEVAASLFVDEDKNILLGDSKGVLNIISLKTNAIDKIAFSDNFNLPIKSSLLDIERGVNGRIWTTSARGLSESNFDGSNQVTHELLDKKFTQNNYPTQIIKFGENILVTGLLSGLSNFNPVDKTFTPVRPINWFSEEVFAPFIRTAIISDNIIWMAGYQGLLYQYDLSSQYGYVYKIQDSAEPTYSLSQVFGLALVNPDQLWIAGIGGLMKFNIINNEMSYIKELSLAGQSFYAVIEDLDGYVWAATDTQLIRVFAKNYSTYTFNNQSGMPITEFSSPVTITESNQLIFGGINGALIFSPEALDFTQENHIIVPSDLAIKRQIASKNGLEFWQSKALSHDSDIRLAKADNSIKIAFSVLNFAKNTNLQYRYRLVNYDKTWNLTETDMPDAIYTQLPHGQYQFEVSFSYDGIHWQSTQSILNIEILPAWWETIWAKIFLIFLILLFIKQLHLWKVRSLKRQANILTETVLERTREIQELLDHRTQFFSYISHEIKTPLSLVQDPLNRLAKDPTHQDYELANIARRNANKVSEMIEKLLSSSSTSFTSPRYTVFLAPKIQNAIRQLSEFAHQNSVSIVLRRQVNCCVRATDDEIDMILFNLLSNAIKYNRKNGRVMVSCMLKNEQCIITIADEGKGLTDFQLLRLDSHGKQRYGLKLVHQVIDSLSGKLKIKSKEGVGTVIHVNLSGTRDTSLLPQSPSNERSSMDTDSTKSMLFIIDDDLELRNYLNDILSNSYHCMMFSNAEDALGKALQVIPDIIISDINLPGMSGIELSRQIASNQETSHIPIILLTAKSDLNTQRQGFENHVVDFMTKPFNSEILTLKIAKLLKLIQQSSQKRQKVSLTNQYLEEGEHSDGLNEKDRLFMQRFMDNLALNYGDSDYKLEDIANDMFMSKTQLSRKLSAICSKTPVEYLKEYRLERSLKYLAKGMSLGDVSTQCGFASQGYFSTCFKAFFEKTPKQLQLSLIKEKRN